MKHRNWFGLLCLLLLASCSMDMESAVRKMIPQNAMAVGDQAIEFYLSSNADELRSIAAPQLKAEASDEALARIFEFRGDGEVVSKKVIGGNYKASTASGRTAEITYEIELSDRYLAIMVSLLEIDGEYLLIGLNVNVMEESYSDQTAFSFKEKSLTHYVFFGLAVAVPLFVLITFIQCIRRKNMKRKVLWCIFVLFGVTGISLNWTTGEVSFSLLNLQLLGAGVLLEDAWRFTIGLPLPAIFWWWKYGIRPAHAGEA